MNLADSGRPCRDQAGHHCVTHQQRLVHVRVWHGLEWRCLGRRIQWLLRQLLDQSGVAKGEPPYPVAEAGDALLQATCCRVMCAGMPDQPTEGHQDCVWRQGSLCHGTGGTTLSDSPIPGVTQLQWQLGTLTAPEDPGSCCACPAAVCGSGTVGALEACRGMPAAQRRVWVGELNRRHLGSSRH